MPFKRQDIAYPYKGRMMNPPSTLKDDHDAESVPILFHDGCHICLDIAKTLKDTIPGLAVINLSKLRQFRNEARERGVERLPSLVVRRKVLAIAPHSGIDHID